MTKWNQLKEFLDVYSSVAYNENNKEKFKKTGRAALKEIAKKLEEKGIAKNLAVYYNPGGIAVSGDHHLKGDLVKGGSFDLFFNLDFSGQRFFTYRKTKNQQDYTGDRNRQIPFEADAPTVIKHIELL
jgi:hypothetical protein